MSHTHITYPQSTERGLSPCHPWQIHEDGDDYDSQSETLLELTDLITEQLTRAEALTWLLQESDNPPEHATRVTAMILLELIQQAREANEKVWELIRQREQNRK